MGAFDYIFGREIKAAVLAVEGVDVEAMEHLADAGVRYYGSGTTRIYCFPTCRNARRITARHRVPFRAAAEAVAAGYRPCTVCRPTRAA
jgi:methylphosphotriester-DNA--protein-cysteine methyltransferase